MRTQRHTTGSVRYDKRRKTWNYLWYDGPVRRSKRIGTKSLLFDTSELAKSVADSAGFKWGEFPALLSRTRTRTPLRFSKFASSRREDLALQSLELVLVSIEKLTIYTENRWL